MNTSILVKCIDELKNDKPNLDYIRGILETFVELNVGSFNNSNIIQSTRGAELKPQVVEKTDEQREQEEYTRQYLSGAVAPLS